MMAWSQCIDLTDPRWVRVYPIFQPDTRADVRADGMVEVRREEPDGTCPVIAVCATWPDYFTRFHQGDDHDPA